jgi:hypothetical protein
MPSDAARTAIGAAATLTSTQMCRPGYSCCTAAYSPPVAVRLPEVHPPPLPLQNSTPSLPGFISSEKNIVT